MEQLRAKPRRSSRLVTTATRPNARVYETAEAFAFAERVDMEFAKLCDYLKPTTLAAIVVDLGNGPFDGPSAEAIEEAQVIAMDALIANVGEAEAKSLIEALEDES